MVMMAAGGFFFMKFVGDELLGPVLDPIFGAPAGTAVPEEMTPVVMRTVPAGAKVKIDGTGIDGRTPMLREMKLTPGEHEAVFIIDGEEAARETFTVDASTTSVVLSEALTESGSVRVETRPVGATVLLDGEEVGKSPIELPKVSYAKAHRIEATKSGYASAKVTVPRDRPLKWSVELALAREGPKGRVVVMTHPSSQLSVDGQSVGGSGPSTLDLPIGDHTLVLAVPGLGVERKYRIEVPDSGVGRYYFDLTAGAQ